MEIVPYNKKNMPNSYISRERQNTMEPLHLSEYPFPYQKKAIQLL